jgi:hypothetical protein
MIEMLPLRERAVLDELNQAEGTDYRLAYCLYEGGERTGYLLYNADPAAGEAQIGLVRVGDEPTADGIIRAVFGSLLDIGIDRVNYSDAVDPAMLERLGFIEPGETVTPSIELILRHCKNCRK